MDNARTRRRADPRAGTESPVLPPYEPLAAIEIDAVTPSERGFTLRGEGSDRAEYRLDLHFELPLDVRTRTVLGELLSQSDLTIARRGLSAGNS